MSEETPPVARMEAAGRNPGNAGETGTPDSAALHPGYGTETQIAQLGDVAHFEMGQSPPSKHVRELDRGLPFLQGNAEFGAIFPAAKLECDAPGKVCDAGDILISVRAPVGALNKADKSYCIGRGLAAVSFNNVDSGFGWHMLNYWSPRLRVVAQGTTFEAVGRKELQQLQIQLFSVHEQRRIAEILDTLDDAIQKTEQLINKLKKIKQGLLHDLLTRGIDENGRLRDPIAHPEQFKDSVLGRIPREWKIVSLQSTALPGKENFVDGDWIEAPWITDSGIRLIQTGNIGEGQFLDKPEFRKYISKRSFRELGCRWVHPGDILICRLAEPIGRACEVPAQVGPSVTAVDCTIYIPNEKIAVKRFMLHLMNSKAHLRALVNIAGGSTRQRISRGNLGLTPVRIPRTDEQERIISVLDAHQAKIDAEYANKDKYRELKKGLTHDLLTGKVRVVPDIMKETVQ